MRLLAVFLLIVLAASRLTAQHFQIQPNGILGPEGNAFVIRGTNVNGPHWPWNRPTVPDADLLVNAWKFNTIRVNCFPSLRATFPQNNADLDAIVRTFTVRKVVVQIENHDFTGKYPDAAQLAELKTWWVDLATRFKANPYVWFNVMNEPGTGATVPETWKTAHEAVVQAIRGTGAENPIILDEHGFGQGNGFQNGTTGSGVLTYGPYFVQQYRNIGFSVHLYATWIYGQSRLEAYLQEARTRQLHVHVGEFGSAETYSRAVAAELFRVLLKTDVGALAWQWDGSDTHDLTRGTSRGGGWEVNKTDGTLPTNLSFVGTLLWKYTHGTLQAGSPDFTLRAPWLYNGGFEEDLAEWINYGGAEVEKNAAGVREGRNQVRINSGTASGCGQPVYLTPGATYVVQAWGRNSLTPTPATDLGVQYKDASGRTQYAVLNFTETEYTLKRREFTMPAPVSDVSVFMYKADKNATFYADDIRVFLKSEDVPLGTEPGRGPSLDVFPNPATDELRIRAEGLDRSTLALTGVDGAAFRVVPEVVDARTVRLRLGGFPAGLYLLTGRQNGQPFARKVTVKF
jgi:hypothetical protein